MGIAHPIVGKYFSGTGGTLGAEIGPGVCFEKGRIVTYSFIFCNILG